MEPLPSCVIFKLATAKLVMTSKPFFPQMLQCLFVSVQILLPNNPEESMALPKRLGGGGGGMCFLVFYSRQHFQRSFSSSALIKKLRSAKSGTVHVWRRKWTDRIKKKYKKFHYIRNINLEPLATVAIEWHFGHWLMLRSDKKWKRKNVTPEKMRWAALCGIIDCALTNEQSTLKPRLTPG